MEKKSIGRQSPLQFRNPKECWPGTWSPNGSRRFRPTKKHARLAARSGMRWSSVP